MTLIPSDIRAAVATNRATEGEQPKHHTHDRMVNTR